MTPARAIWILLVGAALISFSPVLVKFAADRSLGPSAIGFWRTLSGGMILFAIAILRGKSLRMSTRAMKYALLAGFVFCVDLYCWHRSIMLVGAGMSTILGNTQVFITIVLSYFAFKERITYSFLFAVIAAFAGVILLVGIGSDQVIFTSDYLRGIFYGVATALAYANYIICLRKGRMPSDESIAKPDAVLFIAYVSIFSAFFLGIASAFESYSFLPTDLVSILSIVALGFFVQALGWWAITSALPSAKTSQAGLILLLQPTLAMIWGTLLFAEILTPLQIVGAIITLVAMYMGNRRE